MISRGLKVGPMSWEACLALPALGFLYGCWNKLGASGRVMLICCEIIQLSPFKILLMRGTLFDLTERKLTRKSRRTRKMMINGLVCGRELPVASSGGVASVGPRRTHRVRGRKS